jgi:hypothetical protein
MTATLWSSHFETDLYSLYWKRLAGTNEQWRVLLRLLPAFAAQAEALGEISGDLQVVTERPDARVFEQWVVTTDVARVQAILSERHDTPQPVGLPLRIEPLLWLPDNSLEVIDFDRSDDEVIARAELFPVEQSLSDPRALKAWRLRKEPVELLTFYLYFGFDEVPTSVHLEVSTRCDLWRTMQLNGEPGTPYQLANADLLSRAIDEIALATNAEITQRPPP